MATHPSILAWRSPWTEGPGGIWSVGLTESDRTKRLSTLGTLSSSFFFVLCSLSAEPVCYFATRFVISTAPPTRMSVKFKPDMRGDWLDRRPPGGRMRKRLQKTPL